MSGLIFSAEKSTLTQCFMHSSVSFGHLFPDQSVEQFLLNKTAGLQLLANRYEPQVLSCCRDLP